MFEKASRLQLRFGTHKGNLSVEDLWDLPLTSRNSNSTSLDDIAKSLNRQLKEMDTESFVVKSPKADAVLQLQFDIVKHVIGVRLAESEKAATVREAKEKKDKILSIIAKKQDEKLESSSLEELQQIAASL